MISTQLTHTGLSQDEADKIALEGYIYLYPLVLMDTTRRQATNAEAGKTIGRGPVNKFCHVRMYPPADFKDVVRPNFDTLYSVAWLDLRDEPIIVTVPDTAGRYYLLPMLDMWSDVFAVPGWRTSGTGTQTIAVVPPGWEGSLPVVKNLQVIDAPTSYVWIIGRTKTDGPDDYAAVHKIQDGMKLELLSEYGKEAPTPAFAADPSIDMKTPPMVQVDKMSGAEFFAAAAEILKENAPHITDWSMIARLRRLGLEVGADFTAADAVVAAAIAKVPPQAQQLMKEKIKMVGRPVNGWQVTTSGMGVYGNFYLQRAIVALVGLGANQPEDAIYPLNVADAEGKPLNGENNYILTFKANEIPPVDAFWSLTMYDAAGFPCANELNRFALSSWMPLVKNEDGSLVLYIQHKNPGKDKEANWLPAPDGPMSVTMRLYAPMAAALNGDWVPPQIHKV